MNNAPEPASVPAWRRPLLSVGHSNHELAHFLGLLRGANVTAVADVRSSPYSRRLPQYNRGELERALWQGGIVYFYLGDLLGGRPCSLDLYDYQGRADYERIRATPAFQQGLERLQRCLGQHTVAMLCGEEDPLDCHRGLMITPALDGRGIRPGHLRKDGSVETSDAMEARLLAETRVGAGVLDGLFASLVNEEERRQLLAEAYRMMARRKAFRLRDEEMG